MFNEYPYVNIQDVNLDWILKHIKELETNLQNFIKINTIKYADPIIWNITTQYEANTVVIDGNTGTAYLSVAPVPTGVSLTNTDYWTPIFSLNLLSANQNITLRDDGTNIIASFPSDTGDWILWNFYLYRVTRPITENTAYVEGFNIERFTVELFIKDYVNQLSEIIGKLDDLTTSNKTSVVNAINSVLSDITDIIGDLDDLNTSDKTSVVKAVNSVLSDTNDTIGDLDDLNTSDKTSVVKAINSVLSDTNNTIGDLDDLTTTDKTSVVNAVNEVVNDIDNIEGYIYLVKKSDNDSLAIQTAINTYKYIVLEPDKTYVLNTPITLSSGTIIDGNGATISVNNLTSGFIINAPSGNWIKHIEIHDIKITGICDSFLQVNGGALTLCNFYNWDHIATDGGSIEKLINIVGDGAEPSKIRIYNISDFSYQSKYIVYLDTSLASPAISNFDGLDISYINQWCNVDGGAVLKAADRTLIHFSTLKDLYMGGQANDLCIISAYYFNYNTEISNIFAEYKGNRNRLILVNESNFNEFSNLILYVHSQPTCQNCEIFNGISRNNSFLNYVYGAFDGTGTDSYTLFGFGSGSRDNHCDINVKNRYYSSMNHLKGFPGIAPLFTGTGSITLNTPGMTDLCKFDANDLMLNQRVNVRVSGHVNHGSDGYSAIALILKNGDLVSLAQAYNDNLNDDDYFVFDLECLYHLNENNVPCLSFYGLSYESRNNDAVVRHKTYSEQASFGLAFYVTSLATSATIVIDDYRVLPIERAINS